MASHPYISGPGNITQMVGLLRKNFPANVTSETVKKFGLASNNESYVINSLQFLGVIDENGKRTEAGHAVMTKHDDREFCKSFEELVKSAYHDLFDLRGDDAWSMSRDQLTSYFRNTDKTSAIIGARQAAVFLAFRELAGYQTEAPQTARPKAAAAIRVKASTTKKAKPEASVPLEAIADHVSPSPPKQQRGDVALTVRIEINLPAEGTQATYDAIFKSIRANLIQ